jgi:nucleoside-diphosphate-sugar epimerase
MTNATTLITPQDRIFVAGIQANNSYPADFMLDNLKIQTNVIEAAWRSGVRRLLFLGSSCIYPKFAEQPIREKAMLTGPLEPTNSHVVPALIRRFHEAAETQARARAKAAKP